MCLIVDANIAHKVFAVPVEPDFVPIRDWMDGAGLLVACTELLTELYRSGEPVGRALTKWARNGKLVRIPDDEISRERAKLEDSGLLRSNDSHILALAIVSKARTLCTFDKNLEADFKDQQIVNKPRGTIYQKAEHKKCLKHTQGCKGYKSKTARKRAKKQSDRGKRKK